MKYRTIVADPPWEYEGFVPSRTGDRFWHRELPYEMLSVEEIAELPVHEWAERDCRLFLWATNRYLGPAFDIARRWGFDYQQTLVWRKTGNPTPMGGSVAPNHAEYLLVCRRGFPARLDRLASSVIDAPKLTHSQKPEAFLDHIERVSPGPYLEMFARRQRLGWDTWGNEALNHVELTTRNRSGQPTSEMPANTGNIGADQNRTGVCAVTTSYTASVRDDLSAREGKARS